MPSITGKDAHISKKKYEFTDREINWLWNSEFYTIKYPFITSINILERRNIIEKDINSREDNINIINHLREKIERNLVKHSEIEWIDKENKRLLTFIINLLIKNYDLIIKSGLHINHFEYFLSIIDNLEITIGEKVTTLNSIRNYWSTHMVSKNETKWIDINNQEQIEWAWNYLKKNNLLIFLPISPFNTSEFYIYIISSFDLLGFNMNPQAKELILLKMKKTWSQKKYRDSGKIKKPYHLPLTKSTQIQLEKLAELKNIRKERVLEILIANEYQSLCLDSKGKIIY